MLESFTTLFVLTIGTENFNFMKFLFWRKVCFKHSDIRVLLKIIFKGNTTFEETSKTFSSFF